MAFRLDNREIDIRTLCEAVLNTPTIFRDNPSGPYQDSCPFCDYTHYYGGHDTAPTMVDLKHTENCAYTMQKN